LILKIDKAKISIKNDDTVAGKKVAAFVKKNALYA
jgi:hypothetical protein